MTTAYRVLLPEGLYVLEGIVFLSFYCLLENEIVVQFNCKKKVAYI